MAVIFGASTFDRLFVGIQFEEVYQDALFVYAKNEETADQIDERFALHISIIAGGILNRKIETVMVLPRQLGSGHMRNFFSRRV